MFKRISKKKLVVAVLAGVLTIAGAISAFAADQPSSVNPVNNKHFRRFDISKISTTIKSAIDSLVTAGTITQTQADAVLKSATPADRKWAPVEGRKNPIDELITAGTITQAQADSIYSAMKTGRETKKSMEDILKELVTADTITEAQQQAVLKTLPQKGITNRPSYGRKNQMDSLVTEGTITQAQADALQEALKPGKDSRKPIEDVLNGLVSSGTITQVQEDAILKAFPSGTKKGMRGAERNEPLSGLVTAGTITQAQADAITTAIKSALNSLDKQ